MNALLHVHWTYLEEAMNRAHVIRLNPTPEQITYFRKACGVARHCYNWALARWKQARAEGRRVKMANSSANTTHQEKAIPLD